MPLSAAQLAELNTLETAVQTAITALDAADPAEIETAIVNVQTAQTALKTFTATLVADTTTPPPALLALAALQPLTVNVGATVNVQPVASGGSGTYTWAAAGLPLGVSIASQGGKITGTPSAANLTASQTSKAFAVTVTVTDTSSPTQTVTASFVITVDAVVVTPPPPTGTLTAVQVADPPSWAGNQIAASWSGFTPVSLGRNGTDTSGTGLWSYPAGTIPAEPPADFNNLISGFTYTITAEDAAGNVYTAEVTIGGTAPPPAALAVAPIAAQTATVGVETTIPVVASGGTPPYEVEATELPAGLAVSGSEITGIPTAVTPAGGAEVTVTVTDSST